MTTLEKIKADIKNQLFVGRILNSKDFDNGLKWCLELIDKYAEQEPTSPCDLCRFNPPSSCDGKPCTMCPAEKGGE